MSLRAAHGSGVSAVVRVETLPADELPAPVVAPLAEDSGPLRRSPDGRFGREAARELGRRGGLARARRIRLVDALGLRKLTEDAAFKPYRDAAEEFTSHHLGQLAMLAGGVVGAAPSSMVASAALQLAASRWCFDKGGETGDAGWMKQGSSFANDSRQNLLAAYELAVREAKARDLSGASKPSWLRGDDDKGE